MKGAPLAGSPVEALRGATGACVLHRSRSRITYAVTSLPQTARDLVHCSAFPCPMQPGPIIDLTSPCMQSQSSDPTVPCPMQPGPTDLPANPASSCAETLFVPTDLGWNGSSVHGPTPRACAGWWAGRCSPTSTSRSYGIGARFRRARVRPACCSVHWISLLALQPVMGRCMKPGVHVVQ